MIKEELLKTAKPILFNTDMVKAIIEGKKTVTRRVVKPHPNIELVTVSPTYYSPIEILNYVNFSDKNQENCKTYYPKYNKGDILYVRETWQFVYETEYEREAENHCVNIRKWIPNFDDISKTCLGLSSNDSCASMEKRNQYVVYKASDISFAQGKELRFNPSIHMPKSAARIFLKIKNVRIERLQDITEKQAIAEGFVPATCSCSNRGFMGGCTDCMNTGILEPAMVDFVYMWNSKIKKQDLDKYGWDANPWVWVYEFERVDVNV